MKYNFDVVHDRSKSNDKHSNLEYLKANYKINDKDEIFAQWIGDMDFQCPPKVVEFITKRAAEGIYGYTYLDDSFYKSVINWNQKRFNLNIKDCEIMLSYGTITALYSIVNEFTKENDSIMINTPVYGPFEEAVVDNGRKLIKNKLVYEDNTYKIDFEDFETKIVKNKVKIFIFCNPHNPGGVVWSFKDLEKLVKICQKNNVIIVSDEVHRDIILKPEKPFVSLLHFKEVYDKIILCCSPNKAFNFGGLKTSYVVVKNKELSNSLKSRFTKNRITSPNTFGAISTQIAYNECEDWLNELVGYLKINFEYFNNFIKKEMKYLDLFETDSSFFAWLNFKKTGLTMQQVKDAMESKNLILCYGNVFVSDGEDFIRINLGSPKSVIIRMLNAFKDVFENKLGVKNV